MTRKTEIARVLRSARDLMNTNGRHWVKGDLKVKITPAVLSNAEGYGLSPKARKGDTAYCTWGGLIEVTDDEVLRVEAMEALVQIIDPAGWAYYLEGEDSLRREYEDEIKYDDFMRALYPNFETYYETMCDSREDTLGDIIANWNDSDKRTWDQVRDSLTKAAAKVKAR